ncbi:MAG: helix-turn-helix domain-containing protein [Acidobacteriota bacterium]
MSTLFVSRPPASPRQIQRDAWRRLFGSMIAECRCLAGRSLEETAGLAGMTPSEWEAIEIGHVPADPARLRSMAAALGIRHDQLALMAYMCRGGWEE